jgi:DNA-binding NtrC family response regulator
MASPEMTSPDMTSREVAAPRTFKDRVDEYERALILSALAEAGGHQRRAAASLGILPTTLCEKMKRLGLRSRAE